MNKMGILSIVILYTHCFYAMELSNAYTCGITKINVKTCSPRDETGKVKCIVVEINEWKLLKKMVPDEYLVGHIDITFAKKAEKNCRVNIFML